MTHCAQVHIRSQSYFHRWIGATRLCLRSGLVYGGVMWYSIYRRCRVTLTDRKGPYAATVEWCRTRAASVVPSHRVRPRALSPKAAASHYGTTTTSLRCYACPPPPFDPRTFPLHLFLTAPFAPFVLTLHLHLLTLHRKATPGGMENQVPIGSWVALALPCRQCRRPVEQLDRWSAMSRSGRPRCPASRALHCDPVPRSGVLLGTTSAS
jgi:hypothetical protein